jgi:hypothetical protein
MKSLSMRWRRFRSKTIRSGAVVLAAAISASVLAVSSMLAVRPFIAILRSAKFCRASTARNSYW